MITRQEAENCEHSWGNVEQVSCKRKFYLKVLLSGAVRGFQRGNNCIFPFGCSRQRDNRTKKENYSKKHLLREIGIDLEFNIFPFSTLKIQFIKRYDYKAGSRLLLPLMDEC